MIRDISSVNSSEKHAYLIEAHQNLWQLEQLLKCLDYKHNDIYLHIDAKSSLLNEYLQSEIELEDSRLAVVPSVKVSWGGYSQIQAELNLLRFAHSKGPYARYHLISGADLPLVSQPEMHRYFDLNSRYEYVHYDYCYPAKLFRNRMGLYHFLQDSMGRGNIAQRTAESILLAFQKAMQVNRIRNVAFELGKGANWFSITEDLARHVLDREHWIKQTFKFTKCCDEVFLQTIVLNSPFCKRRYFDDREGRYGNMRAVDWRRGNPYIWRTSDYDALMGSGYMFARKFDSNVDKKIIQKIVSVVSQSR